MYPSFLILVTLLATLFASDAFEVLIGSAGDYCMSVEGNATSDGAAVVALECNGAPSQQWEQVGETLVNSASGRCLDRAGGCWGNNCRV